MKKLFKIRYLLVFIGLFGLISYLGLDKHEDYSRFHYRSELWSDKSGYYIYLPAYTLYDFDTRSLPDSIDEKMGTGFHLDLEENKINNQFSCGLALLWSPFYGMAHLYAKSSEHKANGFTSPYYKAINYAAGFYFAIAIILLYLYLRKNGISYINAGITILAIILGTNTYYYAIDENGMSHMYSFTIVVCLFYLADKFFRDPKIGKASLIGLLSGLLVLIRPTNVILLFLIVFLNAGSWDNTIKRFQLLLTPRYLLVIVGLFFIPWLPQFAYWYDLSGSIIYYSYGHRGFDNWNNPQILNVLFNPHNGLLPNAPVVLLCLIATAWQFFKDRWNAVLITLGFIVLTYLFSSWYVWHFGCSFGQRSFVEFFPFLAFPFAHFMNHLTFKSLMKWLLIVILATFITFELILSYKYPECFMGESWSWEYLMNQITK